jgi:diguanylate cyclase (GGDEF)-like protein
MAVTSAMVPGHRGGPLAWMLRRYLPMAWGSLATAVLLHVFVGGAPEAIVDGCFLALNLAAHLVYRRRPVGAVALHLSGIGIMIFAYCAAPGSLPALLGDRAIVFAALAALPHLVMASLFGIRSVAISAPLGIMAVVALADEPGQLVTGTFLVAVSGILGGGFYHRLLVALEASQRSLTVAAYQDPMTGLGNRRAFAADFDRLSVDDGLAGWVLLVWDVDGLKAVNDEFGHGAGDAYLGSFVDALVAACGPDARLFRLGGDEFASLHAPTTEPGRTVAAVRRRFPWVSVGSATLGDESLNTALIEADRSLYADKAVREADRVR